MTEATNNEQPAKVLVSAEPLRRVLHALVNAPHQIRELQATREPVALFADNPINVLVAEFEAGFDAAPPAAAVVPEWLRSKEALGERLYAAGWRDHADAQWSGAESLRLELLAHLSPAPVEQGGFDVTKATKLIESLLSNHGAWLSTDPYLRDLRKMLAAPVQSAMVVPEGWRSMMERLIEELDDVNTAWRESMDFGEDEDENGEEELCDGTDELIEEARAMLAAAPTPEPASRVPWLPYLSDRADGVRGHYAIARHNPSGYREVWNLRLHCWGSFSDDVLTLDQAIAILEKLTMPTTPEQPAKEVQ